MNTELPTLALAQVNPTVGDLAGNVDRMLAMSRKAAEQADLVVFPELVLPGYPPKDLLKRPGFITSCEQQLDRFCRQTPVDALVGTVHRTDCLYNAAAYVVDGRVDSWYHKQLLPTYDVFDEARYFRAGPEDQTGSWPGAVTVCEDIWNDPVSREVFPDVPTYPTNPVGTTSGEGPLINLSASPYEQGKPERRLTMLKRLAREYERPVVVANLVGGNDALVFDGHSVVVSADGEVEASARGFEEDLIYWSLDRSSPAKTSAVEMEPDHREVENLHQALVLGLRDYARKCGFDRALLGLSGGIDSGLTAALAVEALGSENVLAVMMPSSISSRGSVEHSEQLIDNLGCDSRVVPIQEMYDSFLGELGDDFQGTPWDTTEENLQARIRGTVLMAYSNKLDHLLLATGNKSELAVGYCTLYGDMNGGWAVLSDVPKTTVYELARYHNSRPGPDIPEPILEKPPSAELAPDQQDQDTLPPYEVLDEIIRRYVEEQQTVDGMVEAGLDQQAVRRTVRLIDFNEYKRQQAPPGLKVTSKSFSAGRKMPIAQAYDP